MPKTKRTAKVTVTRQDRKIKTRQSHTSFHSNSAAGSCADCKEGKDSGSTTEELELELEALDIADEPLELEGADEAENEELAKKLLDEQGTQGLCLFKKTTKQRLFNSSFTATRTLFHYL